MKHLLIEENGDFKAATVLSEAGANLQIELASGRRSKVKTAHVMLRFDASDIGALIPEAQRLAAELDIDFLWQCAPQDEFGFLDLATEYYGGKASPEQATALLLKLHSAPIHFHRKGRGRYRPAPEDTVKAALASLERRRQQEQQIEALAAQMLAGELPQVIATQAQTLLVRPDKMSIEYRALDLALRQSHQTPERLLLGLGAFGSARALHLARFAAEHFPAGIGFDGRTAQLSLADDGTDALPLAEVAAFSIDDSSTTEIDDALSVQALPGGGWRIGIHIAAPGLGIATDSDFDLLARERMSSVYMPGDKITMLPEQVVARYSLDAGKAAPALSLYLDLDTDAQEIVSSHSRVERVPIAENLRHEACSDQVTEAALTDPESARQLPFGEALQVLWRLTLASCAQRERVRGKPEPRFRTDFSFRIHRDEQGERVHIEQRRRDAPLDRIVAEMMILANSHWGALLDEHQAPGIYRSQQGGRVRMSIQALPHEGLGVSQYMWSTSPLRRYVDLINQRQLIAVLRDTRVPFGPKDAALFSIISGFDARHGAYQDFQQQMERLWCLRWLAQEGITRTEAVVVREDVVRLARAPFYFRMSGLPELSPGRQILVDLAELDEVDVSLRARFVDLAPTSPDTPEAAQDDQDAVIAEPSEAPSS